MGKVIVFKTGWISCLTGVFLLTGCEGEAFYDYSIHQEDILSEEGIVRVYSQGFDLDDINIGVSGGNIVLNNNTPRTIENPLFEINGGYYTLKVRALPFTEITFKKPDYLEKVTQARFVDTRPFFKAHVTSFVVDDPDPANVRGNVSEEQYQGYVDDMLSQKHFANKFDLNVHFLEYQNSTADSEKNIAVLQHSACDYELGNLDSRISNNSIKAGNNSSYTSKLVSLRAYKPKAEYRMLENSHAVGLATIGNGWLSVSNSQLHSGVYDHPSSTYEHEKLHNHGFDHASNMTYGWSDEFVGFIKRNGISFYAEENHVETDKSFIRFDPHSVGDNRFMVTMTLVNKEAVSSTVEDLLIANDGDVVILEAGTITEDGSREPLNPVKSYDNMTSALWQGRNLMDSVSMRDVNSGIEQGFYFVYETKAESSLESAKFIVSGKDAAGESINGLYTHPKALGVVDASKGYEQWVIAKPVAALDDEGFFIEDFSNVTPLEAEAMCASFNLSLGELHPYKSQEMIDFQSRHLELGSQVGLDETTKLPVAVNVPTTYSAPKISYKDKGKIVVCQ